MTAHERTGWRDEAISGRHRLWGYNCPAVDLDFLVAEYNTGEPVALVEYKHERAQQANLLHPTYRAIRALCDGYVGTSRTCGLPFMVVYYRQDPWRFLVMPANEQAVAFYHAPISLSEQRYVKSLYILRSRVVQQSVLDRLDSHEDAIGSWPAFVGSEAA